MTLTLVDNSDLDAERTSAQVEAVGVHATSSVSECRLHVQNSNPEVRRGGNSIVSRISFACHLERSSENIGGILSKRKTSEESRCSGANTDGTSCRFGYQSASSITIGKVDELMTELGTVEIPALAKIA